MALVRRFFNEHGNFYDELNVNWLRMPDAAEDIDDKNEVVDFILTVHQGLSNIFVDDSRMAGTWNRLQFYAIRHQNYFTSMNWADEVLQFYESVAEWHSLQNGPDKKELYAMLIVDAFRLQART